MKSISFDSRNIIQFSEFFKQFFEKGKFTKKNNFLTFTFSEKIFFLKELIQIKYHDKKVESNQKEIKLLVFSKHSTSLCPLQRHHLPPNKYQNLMFIIICYDYKLKKYTKNIFTFYQIIKLYEALNKKLIYTEIYNILCLRKLGQIIVPLLEFKNGKFLSTIFEKIR